MDDGIIDLTDPLEDVLKKSSWTTEQLNARLSVLVQNSLGSERDPGDNMTLHELLNNCNGKSGKSERITLQNILANHKPPQPEIVDTILISDDEEPEEDHHCEEDIDAAEGESVTEVEVVEVSDVSSNGSSNQCEYGAFEGSSSSKISYSESDNASTTSWATLQSKNKRLNRSTGKSTFAAILQNEKIKNENSSNATQAPYLVINGRCFSLPVASFASSKCHLEEEDSSRSSLGPGLKSWICEDSLLTISKVPFAESPGDKDSKIPVCKLSGAAHSEKTLATESLCDDSSEELPKTEFACKNESMAHPDSISKIPLSEVSGDQTLTIPDGEYELNADTLCKISSECPTGSKEKEVSPSHAQHCEGIEKPAGMKLMRTELEQREEREERGKSPEAKVVGESCLLKATEESGEQKGEDSLLKTTEESGEEGKILEAELVEENCLLHLEEESPDPPTNEGKIKSTSVEGGMHLPDGTEESLHESRGTSRLDDADEVTDDERETPATNPEEIRKNLMLQLSNLRGRKKMNILEHVQQTVNEAQLASPISKAFEDSNQSSKSSGDKSSFELISTKSPQPAVENTEVIQSVPTEDTQPVDCREDEDVHNVFNEIRKIIRKPKALPVGAGVSKTSKPIIDVEEIKSAPELTKPQNPTVVEKYSKNIVSSPFISNSLDEFLIDAKLNVSYAIPKSGAEEGLKQDYTSVDPVIPHEAKVKQENINKPKGKAPYKAKTLAEKRKILEKHKRLEERRLRKQQMQTELQTRSYVWFKNKKIYVSSKLEGKCLASVESTMQLVKSESSSTKKPSLLTQLNRQKRSLLYKPGPLSKKHLLQSNYADWVTELKVLPKVVVDVRPEFGKPVPDHILSNITRGWDGSLCDDQVEFALAALPGPTNERIFQFDVNYENGQGKVLVRKKKGQVQVMRTEAIKEPLPSDFDTVVAGVLEDLIRYVEIKEISSDLLKEEECEEVKPPAESKLKPSKPLDRIKPEKIRNCSVRTKRELLRLNCKLVTMDANVSAKPKKVCTKPHCRLGCVCESLRCETIIGIHCRKVACMFECTCPRRQNAIINISVPNDTDGAFLTRDTVNRIEDEAKKNLAKEEREFTQTIIYSNNNAIVLGSGYKPRRAARAPKKYTDFFEDPLDTPEVVDEVPRMVPCSVSLEKLNLRGLIPYCLEHNLHNCHCRGLDVARLKKLAGCYGGSARKWRFEDSYAEDKKRFKAPKKEPAIDTVWPMKVDAEEPDSARTRVFFKKVRKVEVEDCENPVTSNQFVLPNPSDLDSQVVEVHLVVDGQAERSERMRRKNKRKQQLKVRQDVEDSEVAPTFLHPPPKRKKRAEESPGPEPVQCLKAVSPGRSVLNIPRDPVLTPSFPGEIIVKDSAWLKKLYNRTKQPLNSYARILPWTALLKGFLGSTIHVYCVCEMPLRLLLTVGSVHTGSSLLDIEQFGSQILDAPLKSKHEWLIKQSESVRDIIKWLLSGTLSARYTPSTLSFLLVETTRGHFEVRGLCVQSTKSISSSQFTYQENRNVSDEITEIKHKNMYNRVVSLFITKWNYAVREFVGRKPEDSLGEDTLLMVAELPDMPHLVKWRVICLNNDFLYLYFKTVSYSIKYSDLVKLAEIAKEEQRTILVRNMQIRRQHSESLFGLYVTPAHVDRVFVGPYSALVKSNDIDTLHSFKGKLISCESFYKMKGKNNVCGQWVYDSSSQPSSAATKVDAECSKPADKVEVASVVQEEKTNVVAPEPSPAKEENFITHNGLRVAIKTSKPRSPSEFNRFIITNIPNFGYLGAFQPNNSSVLEVSWPFEKKVLQFRSAEEARDFLQERFSQLLLPVPESFKIQVIVLINLDLNEYQPINSDILNGQSICGYFGTYSVQCLTEEFCRETLKIPKQEITALFAKRAVECIRLRTKTLADLVGEEIDTEQTNIANILQLARAEISSQQTSRRDMLLQIQKLEKSVSDKILKVFSLIKDLPAKERNIDSRILNEILQVRPRHLPVSEVIEIPDDDDDDDYDGNKDKSQTQAEPAEIAPSEAVTPAENEPSSTVSNLAPINTQNDDEIAEVIPVESDVGSLPIIIDVRTVIDTDDEGGE